MQKKVIAIAVAGALAAPAVAMAASTSTVQIYGNLYTEYSFINQGRSTAGVDLANVDYLQTPGSAIGFKGEEKLGGSLSAWFQCESTADIRGVSSNGFCTRNSAVGLKSGFGNLFVGNWDAPFKRARVGNVGGRDTGVFGTAFLMYGSSTTVTDGGSQGVFSRRQRNSINYDSPKFGGFQLMGQVSSTNNSTNRLATAANAKARNWSVAGVYSAGPLALGAGYQKNEKAFAAGTDEDGYHLSASYKIGPVKLGGAYTRQEWDDTLTTTGKVSAYHLGAEWAIAGPHVLHFGYTQAGDIKGNAGATGTRSASGANTGAKLWQIRYQHNLSKRTYAGVGYVHLRNETAGSYTLGGFGATGAGAQMKGVAFNLGHRF